MKLNSNGGVVAKILGIGAIATVVLLVVAVIGARWWLANYLQGEKFRKLISEKTSAAMHARGEYLPLHWQGSAASSEGFYATGLPGSPLEEVRADMLRADLDWSGVFQKKFRVDGMEIQRLKVRFISPTPATQALPMGTALSSPATQGVRVELGPIRVQEANLQWPMSGGAKGMLRRSSLVLMSRDNDWCASVTGGELAMADWPVLRIEKAQLRSRAETLYVIDSLARLANGGIVSASGEVHFDGAKDFNATVRFDDVPAANWLPEDWRGKLVGQARGESRVRGRLEQSGGPAAEGTIALLNGRLQALPVLDKIAIFTQTEQFRCVDLHKATAEFSWKDGRLDVKKLLMESTGLLRVEGGCVVEKETIDGTFDVGVSADTLRWLPGARGRVFTVDRGGYLWTKVKLTGPLKNVKEDLSDRLIVAAGKEVFEGTKNTLEKGAQMLFDLLK